MELETSKEILSAFPPAFAYVGVLVIGFLSNMVIPVPEEIVFIGLGYLVGSSDLSFFPTVGCIIVGLLFNDTLLYYLARKGNRIMRSLYNRLFEDVLPLDSPFLHNHLRTVIISSRFLVQFRLLGPFFAGTLHVPLQKFLKWDLIALIVYVPLFVGVGAFFQSRVERVIAGFGSFYNILLIFLGVIAVVVGLKYAKKLVLKMYTMVSADEVGQKKL
jgi:membrane protein DedA with SNARE-associated domain